MLVFNLRTIGCKFFRDQKRAPLLTKLILFSALLCQLCWSSIHPSTPINIKHLQAPPDQILIQLVGLGDSIVMAKLLMLWLQAFDHQPGINVPFVNLDYLSIIKWLERILALDPKGQYPLLAASYVYSLVQDDQKKRQMLDFIQQQFFVDPNRRWPSMMHAIFIAKHKLKDYSLALEFAHAVAQNVTDKNVPHWVKQMEIYILEDMGEIESAKILIGGLLESGTINDPHELIFLKDRLIKLEQNQ